MKVEGKRNVLQTDVVITVNELLFGEYDESEVVVRVNKGYDKVNNVKYISDGYPDFKVGEHVVLFLSRDDGDLKTDENYFVTTGMLQGKWNVDKNGVIKNTHSYANHLTFMENKSELKTKIKKENTENPDWKEKRKIERERIKKQNIELFGE